MSFRFDTFTLDTEARLLTRDGGAALHLSPKAFRLLELLLAERPRALAKEALMHELWPATHVCEDNLTGLVAELRSALGDSPRQARFIRTVHRFGYAFCGEAALAGAGVKRRTVPATPWSLRLLWEGKELALAPGDNILGRGSAAAARIDAPGVSREHACITVDGSEATIADLGSKNGTYVAGVRLEAPRLLADGDELRLGGAIVTYRATRAEASTQTLAG